MLETFYSSSWQQPGLLGIAAVLAFGRIIWALRVERQHPQFAFEGARAYLWFIAILAPVDVWLTSQEVWGVGALQGIWAEVLPLLFVYLGDLRYFLLIECIRPGGRLWRAFAISVLIPIVSALIHRAYPSHWQTPRALFLTYEISFLLLLVIYGRVILRPALAKVRKDPELLVTARRLGTLTAFVGFYYFLWAFSDALILSWNLDVSYGLRVLPNLLYYGGFQLLALRAVRK